MYYFIWNIEICWIIFSKMLTAFKIYENMHLVRKWIRNRKEETHASLYLYIVWTSVAGGFVCFDACCSLAAFWRIYLLWCMLLTCSVSCWIFFWDYIVQLRHSQRTHTHTHMNTRTQTLPIWAFSKTEPANPRNWRSHHMRFAVDENIAYHTTPLNLRIFAPMGSQTQYLRCYRDSCNH